jgi:hypothetical protein
MYGLKQMEILTYAKRKNVMFITSRRGLVFPNLFCRYFPAAFTVCFLGRGGAQHGHPNECDAGAEDESSSLDLLEPMNMAAVSPRRTGTPQMGHHIGSSAMLMGRSSSISNSHSGQKYT